jgi:hypothetical protein
VNQHIQADLILANLSGANLNRANLNRANLCGAELSHADLSGADLSDSVLIQADLSHADLSDASLNDTDLNHADLSDANLSDADLDRANLSGANLNRVNLSRAELFGADLSQANLSGADLSEVNLMLANLIGANLIGANFSNVRLSRTVFAETDISEILNLDTVKHRGPSVIGLDTFIASKGKIPKMFLQGAGVPDVFLEYVASLTGQTIEFYSPFISYSSKDEAIAKRLYADLQAKGVRCWLFPEDAKWGEPKWGEIDREIRVRDKLLVICSEHSLQSEPVLREIERALQREDKEHKSVLFPVSIDDYIFKKWEHSRKADVVNKVVGDMQNWTDRDSYQKAFNRLLQNLKPEKLPK